jgi:hypothetical protein
VFPRGSKAGLDMEDKGDVTPGFDSLGNRFEAYTSWFRQQAGLCPKDWRYGVRCANIDTTTAGLAGPNALDIFATMAQMIMLFPKLTRRLVRHHQDRCADGRSDAAACLVLQPHPPPLDGRAGDARPQRAARHQRLCRQADHGWRDLPIKIVDQLVNTETRVV